MAKVSRWQNLLSGEISTVRRGEPSGAVVLSSDDHPMTPRNRFAVWHTLHDAKRSVA